jgi:hypothetical protein
MQKITPMSVYMVMKVDLFAYLNMWKKYFFLFKICRKILPAHDALRQKRKHVFIHSFSLVSGEPMVQIIGQYRNTVRWLQDNCSWF